jgi:glycosyltransferase involved in cell wall biosynthesis
VLAGCVELNYFGLLRSPASWAKIGRELVNAFVNVGDEVCVFERRGFLYDTRFPIPDSLKIMNTFKYDKTLTFEHPSNYKYITSLGKYGMLVYETTEAPDEWARLANEKLDILFLPNEFNRKIFTEAGVRPELIRVVPHGINPEIFGHRESGMGFRKDETRDPQPETRNRFTFLTVAMPQKRKGLDVLLSAFSNAFNGEKEIELLIKFPYAPGKSGYDISNADLGIGNPTSPRLRRTSRESGIAGETAGILDLESRIPNVKFITGGYTEEQMAGLYRSADCFVLPSRAEGFGLVYLEALACGLPVIATGWGGHTEFLNEKNSLLVKYKTVPAGNIQYDNQAGKGLMAEPDPDDLVDKMRYMVAYYNKETEKIENLDLSGYYWGNIVRAMKGVIQGQGVRG